MVTVEIRKLTFREFALRQSDSSEEGLTLETSAFEFFTGIIHIIDSVDKTKLSCNTLHRRSTTVSLETNALVTENKVQGNPAIYTVAHV